MVSCLVLSKRKSGKNGYKEQLLQITGYVVDQGVSANDLSLDFISWL